jgi:hypothetical protein
VDGMLDMYNQCIKNSINNSDANHKCIPCSATIAWGLRTPTSKEDRILRDLHYLECPSPAVHGHKCNFCLNRRLYVTVKPRMPGFNFSILAAIVIAGLLGIIALFFLSMWMNFRWRRNERSR